jgi:hypothetical protein
VLDLSGLSLETVPAMVIDFPMLHTLREVSLAYNQLRDLPPAFVCQCAQLETLRLEHNLIQTLPSNMHNLRKLRTLNLEHNKLQSLSENLCQLPVLHRALVAGNNGITSLPPNLHYAGDGVVVVRRRPEVENEQREWAAMTIQVCYREWQWYLLMDEMHRKVHLQRIQKIRERRRQPGHHVHFVSQRLPRETTGTLHSVSGSALLSPASERQLASLEDELGLGCEPSAPSAPSTPHRLRLASAEEEREEEQRQVAELQRQARVMVAQQEANVEAAAVTRQRWERAAEEGAALALQCWCRGVGARGAVVMARYRTRVEKAAVQIQARERSRCAISAAQERKCAAIVVGSGARGAVARRRVRMMRLEQQQQQAATGMQCAERQRQALLEAERRRAARDAGAAAEDAARLEAVSNGAAVAIQRTARGRRARLECRVERARRRQRQRAEAKESEKEEAKEKKKAKMEAREGERQQRKLAPASNNAPRNVVGGAGAMVRRHSIDKTGGQRARPQLHRVDIGGVGGGGGKGGRRGSRRGSAGAGDPHVQKAVVIANTVEKLRRFHADKQAKAEQHAADRGK